MGKSHPPIWGWIRPPANTLKHPHAASLAYSGGHQLETHMKASRTLALTLGTVALACGMTAQAGVRISDSDRITNGGTGHIGITQSIGQPMPAPMARMTSVPAGEATTLVDGQPNVNPDTVGWTPARMDDARRMGAPAARSMPGSMPATKGHPTWGTPD
jgi:hypothetical protein